MGNIDVLIESELFEVKVPIVFLGTMGFSLRSEGRYLCLSNTTANINKCRAGLIPLLSPMIKSFISGNHSPIWG